MKEHFSKILACPECKGDLTFKKNNECYCRSCNKSYKSLSHAIDFLQNQSSVLGRKKSAYSLEFNHFVRKIYKKIKPSSTFKTKESKVRIINLLKSVPPEEFSINIGSGRTNYSPEMVNIDIEFSENVDIIADARSLPIKAGTISLAVSQAVLEHTPDTKGNINEITRVLKSGGVLYIEVPFMQTYHAHPHDYFRFTHHGLKSYLSDYNVEVEGIAVGPASATALNIRVFLSTLFSFGNKKFFLFWVLIFGWVTYPMKFLDYFMEKNPLSFYGASGIYVIARKKD